MSNTAVNNYKAQLRYGNIVKAPGYYNRRVAIWDHNNFYKGWIQCGRSKEIFNKIRFAKAKVEVGIQGSVNENGEVKCPINSVELNFLEAQGMKFIKGGVYQQLKCVELFKGLGN